MSKHSVEIKKKKTKSVSFKDLLKLFAAHKIKFIIGLIMLVIYVGISSTAPVVLNEVMKKMDSFSGPGANFDSIWYRICFLASIVVVLYFIAFSSYIICNIILTFINVKVVRNMREQMNSKFSKLPLRYFDKNTVGDTLNTMVNASDEITQNLSNCIMQIVQACIYVAGIFSAMFILSWQLALSCLVAIPIGFISMGLIVGFSKKYFTKRMTCLAKLNSNVEESYTGITIIELFNLKEHKRKDFSIDNQSLQTVDRKAAFFGSVHMNIFAFTATLGNIVVGLVTALLAIKDATPNYWLTFYPTFIIFVGLLNQPLSNFAQGINSLQITLASYEKVVNMFKEEEMLPDTQDKQIKTIKGGVEFKNVEFRYNPDKPIINNFSATIKPGMKVAIVGPTGAGKTTIVNLLMRFYEINSGSILIDGVNIKDMKREYLRSMFGMVLQDPWTFEGTIKDNISYSKEVSFDKIRQICKETDLDHVIMALPNGYDAIIDDKTVLSNGEKQMLTIVRAMVQNAPLVILDEATSNIDTRTELMIQSSMDKLTKGRTSFVIAHRLSTIKNADLIIVMSSGDIVEQGNHEQLLKRNGFYAKLYNTQFSEEM
ncbi:MAG: ABC transporter ATP-binding protein [Mycoplasmoidaceae bacterium]|nr:MAG: ABC transporter ATP-binding protein [Mycoplasmoidaceae bacterium]